MYARTYLIGSCLIIAHAGWELGQDLGTISEVATN